MKKLSSVKASKTDWKRVRAMKDGDIAFSSEHPEADVRHIVRGTVRRGLKPLRVKDSASLRAELDRRLDAYEADGNPGRPAERVIADIRKKLRSRKKAK